MKLIVEMPLESFVSVFSQMNHSEYKNFIKHSLQVAKLARKIANMLNLPIISDSFYLAGMLHDIGLAVKASVENYELFVDMFRNVSDLEKIVLTFDKADKHALISYVICSKTKLLCPLCAKGVLYHHTPYQKISENDDEVIHFANCIKAADIVSLTFLKYEQNELTVDLLEKMIDSVQKDEGILQDVKEATLEILKDYRCICQMLDDEHRFSSQRFLTLEEYEQAARILATLLDLRSPYTRNHTFLVAKFAKMIASEILSEEDARLMSVAAFLHDLGKLKTPLTVLHKKGRLDEKELIIMRKHVVDAYMILEKAGLLDIANISCAHHERLDGTGYPTGLKKDQTSIFQRIIQICDVFSALVEHRPYREAMSISEAFSVIEKEVIEGKLDGTVYDKLKEVTRNIPFEEEVTFHDALKALAGVDFSEIK